MVIRSAYATIPLMNERKKTGFTLVEVLIVIVVIGILAAIGVTSYNGTQRRAADALVLNTVTQAADAMSLTRLETRSYPPNLAGTGFVSAQNVSIVIATNAPTIGIYDSLSPDENAQLFLNVCNANLSGLNNTTCVFAGNGGGAKIHVKGTTGSNTIWRSPIAQGDVTLSCGAACDAATSQMIQQFLAQGGKFPVIVSGRNAALPQPTIKANGPADRFCLEARSGAFGDVVYHTTNAGKAAAGACPDDPTLHYFVP